MSLEANQQFFIFKRKDVWFADFPYDVVNADRVVFNDCKNKVDLPGFGREEFSTIVIDLNKDLGEIWAGIDARSTRSRINRAVRENIAIKSSDDYREFYKINESFREKKKLNVSTDIDMYKNNGILFYASMGGEIVSCQFYLYDKNTIRWLIGASKRLEAGKEKAALIGCANRLIIWEAIKFAKGKGLNEFDLGGVDFSGGTGDPKYSISKFKETFGGNPVARYIYRKTYSKEYKFLSELKNGLKNFFKKS
jgi:hypothetical protein